MKIIFIFIISFNLFAANLIDQEKEKGIIISLVKSLKKEVWQSGHDNIESTVVKFDKQRFDKFIKVEMVHMEEELYEDDYPSILNCLAISSCSLYKIDISSEFYAGFGFDYHIVRVDLETGSVSIQKYAGYNE